VSHTLTPEQREAAWKMSFRFSLGELPDREMEWEARTWRELGVEVIADVCDEMLASRRYEPMPFSIPGGADAADLDRLLASVNARAVMRLVEDEALCLVAAIRLVYWAGLREATR
jgi:hypothetical protein